MMTEDDDQQAAVWVVLIGVVLLAVGLTVGVGLQRSLKSGDTSAIVQTAADAAQPSGATATDSASQEPSAEAAPASEPSAESPTADEAAASDAASPQAEAAQGDPAEASEPADDTPAAAQAAAAASQDATASNEDQDSPSLRVDEDKVTFYFATGKAELAEGAQEALADIIKGVAIGRTAVISGYHDPTGDLARNQELARARAETVAEALRALGVSEDKLELRKPEQTEAEGQSLAEARRVEVQLQ